MSINSAMYTAVTGLSALGTGMQTISNNIANVNTVGFKAMRTNYEDLISQNYYSGGKANQRGCGVKVSTIQSMFTQGAFMSSAQDTDMAIAGEGFFQVRNPIDGGAYYTRAGVFTLTKDGLMEDPSGNVLQGWQMSIPKPGQESVKIGALTDVKIIVLNAPPVETSTVKVVNNLDSRDKPAFYYNEHQMADDYADSKAVTVGELARQSAVAAVYDVNIHGEASLATVPATSGLANAEPITWTSPTSSAYNEAFLKAFNNLTPKANPPITDWNDLRVVSSGTTVNPRNVGGLGYMTESEFESIKAKYAKPEATALAEAAGEAAYLATYQGAYTSALASFDTLSSALAAWKLEGNGFAEAWDAWETPYIDQENYTHVEPIEIYDSLGNAHKLMVYYQKNPHMENVWDYIITCDPLEDARKDANNNLLLSDTASFSGLIQKGKITFSADGDDRHGGLIKDIEAQNIDWSKTKMATIEEPDVNANASTAFQNAAIGGYFKGSPDVNPATGVYASNSREYTIAWGGNVQYDPPTSGFTWTDTAGNTGHILVQDPAFAGPYEFGSGLTITFDKKDAATGLNFISTDTMTVKVNSEQIAWTNLTPNKVGHFDFDVAFVQSASMALHPPYPAGMPTVMQNIALDMGAKNPNGLSPQWILDESSTTQYADKSATFFNGQDGYPAGSLQRVSIGEDGVVTGVYSNGRHQPLYQIGLTRFMNPWGLSKEGDNLFAETRYSGAGATNQPGYGGTGTILANYLEQSNVDLAEEIVNMIVTQRGFQANSKTVTTTDTMLAEVIEMKR